MSKTPLSDLLNQKAELEKQIAEMQRQERTDAIAQVRTLMTQYGLSLADLAAKATGPKVSGPRAGGKVAAKYRNLATGDSWSGRGLQPRWLKAALASGRKLSEFEV